MKYCNDCGNEFDNDVQMCDDCGSLSFQTKKPIQTNEIVGNIIGQFTAIEVGQAIEDITFTVTDAGINIYFNQFLQNISLLSTNVHLFNPGFYAWENIKGLNVKKDKKHIFLFFEITSGESINVFSKNIDSNVEEYLITKQCKPDKNDLEYKKNAKTYSIFKVISAIISIIILFIIIFIFLR